MLPGLAHKTEEDWLYSKFRITKKFLCKYVPCNIWDILMLKNNFCLKFNVLFHLATRPSPWNASYRPFVLSLSHRTESSRTVCALPFPAYQVSLSHLYFISAKHSISHKLHDTLAWHKRKNWLILPAMTIQSITKDNALKRRHCWRKTQTRVLSLTRPVL